MDNGFIDALREIVGADNVLAGGETGPVALPADTQEVAKVLALANSAKVPVYPRGGGTEGGGMAAGDGLVLATSRLSRIVEIDTANLVAVAEAGVAMGELEKAVAAHGLFYPAAAGAAANATLGGTVSAGPSGLRALKYGAAKHYVMGLEVVLADGRVLQTGGKTVKDVAGYDLTKLLTGAAGTLGVLTRITLKLMPAPEARQSIMAAFADVEDAGRAVKEIIAAKVVPAAVAIMDTAALRATGGGAEAGLPAATAAILLVEVDGIAEVAARDAAAVAEALRRCGASGVRTAGDETWLAQVREALAAAAQKLGGTGGSPANMAAMQAIKQALDPNCILSPGKLFGGC